MSSQKLSEEERKRRAAGQARRYKKWYEAHKEEFSQQRRDRYNSDPEYRERMKLRAKQHYWFKRRKVRTVLTRGEVYVPRSTQHRDIEIKDPEDIRNGMIMRMPLWKIGTIAEVVERTSQTVYMWGRAGLLPDPPFRSENNHRLYTWPWVKAAMTYSMYLKLPEPSVEDSVFMRGFNQDIAKLTEQGIVRMHVDEWEEDPDRCPYCGAAPGLRHKENGEWKFVPCFSCVAPWWGPDRTDLRHREPLVVQGKCPGKGRFQKRVYLYENEPIWHQCSESEFVDLKIIERWEGAKT